MSALDKVRLALGGGDPASAPRIAAIALLAALPTWLALAILLAIGTGR